jgi:integrase
MDGTPEETVEWAKALKPQVPSEYLLRTRNGGPYSARGFSAIWQRLMRKAVGPNRDGAASALADRFTFHDLRAKCASDNASLEGAGTFGTCEHADDKGCVSSRDPARDSSTVRKILGNLQNIRHWLRLAYLISDAFWLGH